jgi:hypothetical protein
MPVGLNNGGGSVTPGTPYEVSRVKIIEFAEAIGFADQLSEHRKRGSPALTGTCPGTLPLSANAAGEEQP